MFRAAVVAAAQAAREWDPERRGSSAAHRCCHLCHERYRALVLDGPLHDLPHDVAHAAVLSIEAVVAERLEVAEVRSDLEPWNVLLTGPARARALAARRRAARGGLVLLALEELGEARAELSELRVSTETALVGLLADVGIDGAPEAWI